MLPPTERLPNIEQLIEQHGYFVIHAPRQTGKTTAMLALAQELTASDRYTAVMLSAEVGAAFPHDPDRAERSILIEWWDILRFELPLALQPPKLAEIRAALGAEPRIGNALRAWA